MSRDYKLYLKDILDSIEKIDRYTNNMPYEGFLHNSLVSEAVVRNFEIIGEAAKNLPNEIKDRASEIPWKEIAGMRDVLIHAYPKVNLEIIWKTIKDKMPDLKIAIKKLLKIISSS